MLKEGIEHLHCVKNIQFHGRMNKQWQGKMHTIERVNVHNQYKHELSHGILNLIFLLLSICFR